MSRVSQKPETKKVIDRILRERSELSASDVAKMIAEKREKMRGLVSEITAAYMLASELGIEITRLKPSFRLMDVVAGLGDVSVTGRVIFIYPPKEAEEPRFKRVLIGDETGKMEAVFWGDRISQTRDLREGDIVRISHAYVRPRLDGRPEINVSERGNIEINPNDINDADYPSRESYFKKFSEIQPNEANIFSRGAFLKSFPSKTFINKGVKGRVTRALFRDEGRTLTVCFWNDKAGDLNGLKPDEWVEISNARSKAALDGSVELHVGKGARIRRLNGGAKSTTSHTKISELSPGTRSANVIARVVAVSSGRFSSLLLHDGSGFVRLYLWEDKARLADEIRRGDVVFVKSADVRQRFGRLSLSLGRLGSISVNPRLDEGLVPPPLKESISRIKDVKESMRNVTIEGEIIEAPHLRSVVTSRGETVDVTSLRVRDDSGIIRVSMWRGLANEVKDLPVGTRLKLSNLFARVGLENTVELSSTIFTTIEVAEGKTEGPPPQMQIDEFKEEQVVVDGRIREIISPSYVYPACPRCLLRVAPQGGTFSCPKCGRVEPFYRIAISALVEIRDGEPVNVILASPVVDGLLGTSGEEAWKLQESGKIGSLLSRLIDKRVRVVGKPTMIDQKKYLIAVSPFED